MRTGTHFYPIEFLKTLRDMYERVVVRGERSADLPMEYEAFGKVLQRRTTIDEDGSVLFASTFASTACVTTDTRTDSDDSCGLESYDGGFGRPVFPGCHWCG
jgi:hypothetical protein